MATVPIALSVLGATIVFGLIPILMWKMITSIIDRRVIAKYKQNKMLVKGNPIKMIFKFIEKLTI